MKQYIISLITFTTLIVLLSSNGHAQSDHIYMLSYELQGDNIEITAVTPIEIPLMNTLDKVVFYQNNKWIVKGVEKDVQNPQLFSIDFDTHEYESLTDFTDGIGAVAIYRDSIYFTLGTNPVAIYQLHAENSSVVITTKERINDFIVAPPKYFFTSQDDKLYTLYKDGRTEMMGDKAGTCLSPYTSDSYTYIYTFNNDYWYLKKYLPKIADSRIIIKMPQAVKEYERLSNNLFISHDGTTLTSYRVDQDVSWKSTDIELPPYKKCKWIVSDRKGTILINLVE